MHNYCVIFECWQIGKNFSTTSLAFVLRSIDFRLESAMAGNLPWVNHVNCAEFEYVRS
jgi:hypothetical protein